MDTLNQLIELVSTAVLAGAIGCTMLACRYQSADTIEARHVVQALYYTVFGHFGEQKVTLI